MECSTRAITILTSLVSGGAHPELEPYLAVTHLNRSLVFYLDGDWVAAKKDLQVGLRIYAELVGEDGRDDLAETLADAWYRSGLFLSETGETGAAIEEFQKAIRSYTELVDVAPS